MNFFDFIGRRSPDPREHRPPFVQPDSLVPSAVSDLGTESVEWVLMNMQVDAEWNRQQSRGVTWWGHQSGRGMLTGGVHGCL